MVMFRAEVAVAMNRLEFSSGDDVVHLGVANADDEEQRALILECMIVSGWRGLASRYGLC